MGAEKTFRIDQMSVPVVEGSKYPAPFDTPCRDRLRLRLGDAAGLSHFGVNKTRLLPGQWSSQRHYHSAEDEFVYILEGEATLVTDHREEILVAGDCAGFPAGEANGHHLQNRTEYDVVYLEIGTRRPETDEAFYPDIDLHVPKNRAGYLHKDGRPYDGDGPRHTVKDQ